jgi:hypothetical protein
VRGKCRNRGVNYWGWDALDSPEKGESWGNLRHMMAENGRGDLQLHGRLEWLLVANAGERDACMSKEAANDGSRGGFFGCGVIIVHTNDLRKYPDF